MALLPAGSRLGNLEVIEVFEFFDFPRLFSCVNGSGQKFFALSIDDAPEGLVWLYVPVSDDRYKAARAGKLTLQEVFRVAEDGIAFKVVVPLQGPAQVEEVWSRALSHDWLPESEERLSIKTATAAPAVEVRATRVARAEHREVLNMALDLHKESTTEAPARKVGDVLAALQELADALGQRLFGEPTTKGPIAADILEKTQLNFAQVYDGSFGLQLKASRSADLLGDSPMGAVLNELYALLSIKADRDLLSNKLHYLKGRAASKYRAFLESVDAMDSSRLSAEWGTPKDDESRTVALSRYEIRATLAIVGEITVDMAEDFQVRCVLIGVNVRTKTYEIYSDDHQKYSGKVAEEALEKIAHARINNRYVATLKQIVEVQATTGEERTRYVLSDLQEITPPPAE